MTSQAVPSLLTIDLDAVVENYHILSRMFRGKTVACVVKADAYGLGVKHIAPALAEKGKAALFFVATLAEGAELRDVLPHANIAVFNGIGAGEEKAFTHYALIPVINTVVQLERWVALLEYSAEQNVAVLPGILHFDTGMNRLGLPYQEAEKIAIAYIRALSLPITAIISHLACADTPFHSLNETQHHYFNEVLSYFPGVMASLCNTSGIFLPQKYHYGLARPGCGLYGISPFASLSEQNPLKPVVTLTADILQVRTVDRKTTVGYGAVGKVAAGTVVATIACGYADGILWAVGDKGQCAIGEHLCNIIGRVSMDLISIDVTHVPEHLRQEGSKVEILGPHISVDEFARMCNTIGYEILTRLGRRFKRIYKGDNA